MKTVSKHGIRRMIPDPPEGLCLATSYTPHHSVCPWEKYGMLTMDKYRAIADDLGIKHEVTVERQERIGPNGTGPGGCVRMGDEMLPSVYHFWVAPSEVETFRAAINKV